MFYALYDENGKFYWSGNSTSGETIAEKAGVFVGYVNIFDSYFDINSNTVVDIPIKPKDYSEFNWQTKQWEDNAEIAKGNVLRKRQQLLGTSDWTDTYSASTRLENYNAWQFYRQQLRDITTQEGYPFNVEWPSQPN
jgi:hypothetical protein